VRPISNESPELLVLENIDQSVQACASDGEMMLLKNELTDGTTCLKYIHFDFLLMFLYKKASVIQKMLLVDKEGTFYDSNP
jgi:hypothetical protein